MDLLFMYMTTANPDLRVLQCDNDGDINYSNSTMSSQRGEGQMVKLSWMGEI